MANARSFARLRISAAGSDARKCLKFKSPSGQHGQGSSVAKPSTSRGFGGWQESQLLEHAEFVAASPAFDHFAVFEF